MAPLSPNNKDSEHHINASTNEKHNYMEVQPSSREDAARLPPRCRPPAIRYQPYKRPTANALKTYTNKPHQLDVEKAPEATPDEYCANMAIANPNQFLELPPLPSPKPETIAQINTDHEVDPLDLAYALEDMQQEALGFLAATILQEFAHALQRAYE